MIHIHQGGTLNTFCRLPLRLVSRSTAVGWEQASTATCSACRTAFGVGVSLAKRGDRA